MIPSRRYRTIPPIETKTCTKHVPTEIARQENGIFQAGLQTKNNQATVALEVMSSTIAKFIADGPTTSELLAAKSNLVNGYPLRIDNNRKLLDNLSSITWNKLPLNTLDVWTKQVAAVRKEDVRDAVKSHLDMRRMISVLVGGTQ